jgi:hypothetical protein
MARCGIMRVMANTKRMDLIGQVFGRLTVISELERRHVGTVFLRYFLCRCECGRDVNVRMDALRAGRTKSCGCLNQELLQERSAANLGDLTGQRFGRLTVLRRSDIRRNRNTYWLCRCDCGNERNVQRSALMTNRSTSCGCLQREQVTERAHKHGGVGTPEYQTWNGMRQRCENPNHPAFPRYGGRGLTVSEDWKKFGNFIRDMGWRPDPTYSLDRINNDLGYFKGNCRWATGKQQQANTGPQLAIKRVAAMQTIVRRYLDNHCANADAEGMSALCECQLCLDARQAIA